MKGSKLLVKLKNNLITGIAVVMPVLFTIMVLNWIVGKVNLLILEPFSKRLEPLFDSPYLIYLIKGGVLFLALFFLILVGAATKILLIKKFFSVGEKIIYRMPIISKIYTSFKEVSLIFLGAKKRLFKRVVLVEYPRKGIYTIGLVTADGIQQRFSDAQDKVEMSSVFIPTTPNPTSGVMIIVPRQELIDTKLTLEEGFKLIISGGAVANISDIKL